MRAYSLGMRQRLAIAVALMQRRDLLVLDEPTNGLDPQGTREVRNLIRELAGDGTTVFTSTHLLAEVEQVCTHAAVMSRGRLVRQSTVAELRAELRPRLVVRTPDVGPAAETLQSLGATDLNRLQIAAAYTVSRAGDAFNTVALVVLVFDLTGSGLGVARRNQRPAP